MNMVAMEAFLARLYTDDALRTAFLAAPETVARQAELDEDAIEALLRIDREGLVLAAESHARKRAARVRSPRSLATRLVRKLRRLLVRHGSAP